MQHGLSIIWTVIKVLVLSLVFGFLYFFLLLGVL